MELPAICPYIASVNYSHHMKVFFYLITFATLFFSCQQEPEVDLNPPPVPVAAFTFPGSPGACTVATPAGYYATGTVLSTTNTVTVQVNVTTAGSYTISTNTVNGYKFSASGTFASTGVQTVVLVGSGTPVAAQTDAFTPTGLAGTAGCTFNITVVAPAPAVYTLSGAPGVCTVATVNGTYGSGTALTSTNTVTVQVNVTSIGTYTITTNTVGGMTFSKSGSFSTTGNQNITLDGTGTPTTGGANILTVGIAGCTFTVTVTGPAVYTLSGAPGACTVATVNGTYATGTALSASNTVTVQVNVTTIGSYTISTATVGGMTFSKSGIFSATGLQTVILNGSGSPTTSGANLFTVGTAGCTFTVTVTGPAVFTLSGAPAACTVATISGTYTAGTSLAAANTVTVQVNVTVVGAYNITTTAGGMTFSKSGIFSATGVQTVTLNGTGIPTTAGVNTFTVGTAGCTFSITVTAPSGTYSCKIDGVFTSFTDRAHAEVLDDFFAPPTPYLYLDGFTGPPNGETVPELQIFITRNNNTAITPGTYNVDGFLLPNGYRIEIDYHLQNPDMSVTIWNTSSTLFPPPNPPFTVIVTSVTATRVKGTFSGTLTNTLAGGTINKIITEGVFDLPVL
jgi:hypothetical protein